VKEEYKVRRIKATLPLKTKIALWWIFVVGTIMVLLLAFYFRLVLVPVLFSQEILLVLIVLVAGILICGKNKNAWVYTVAMLSIEIIFFLLLLIAYTTTARYSYYYHSFSYIYHICCVLHMLIPLIFIILDRKNYFEMVRQLELSKKDNEKAKSVE